MTGAGEVLQKVEPTVSMDGAPGEGLARVVIDGEPGRALVEKISGGSIGASAGTETFHGSVEVRSRLCTTPCVVDLRPGPYELRFTSVTDRESTSSAFINVDNRPSVYRHALGRHENNAWKGFVGWPLAVLASICIIGGGYALDDGRPGAAAGGFAFGAGVGALAGYLIYGSTVVEQPGSGVQWHPNRH